MRLARGPNCTLGVWGPPASWWGSGRGDTWVSCGDPREKWGPLSGGSGREDLCSGVGGRLWGPSHGTWGPRGTLVLESGCGDPCTGVGTWGRLRDARGGTLGTLVSGLASGLGDPFIGVALEGPLFQGGHLRTSALGSGLGDHRAGTAASPRGSGGRGGQVVSVPFLLAGTVTRGQLRAPCHPGWLRIIRMRHRSRLTPSRSSLRPGAPLP